jgi:hypothetical protein
VLPARAAKISQDETRPSLTPAFVKPQHPQSSAIVRIIKYLQALWLCRLLPRIGVHSKQEGKQPRTARRTTKVVYFDTLAKLKQ